MFEIKKIITISDYITIFNLLLGLLAIYFNDFRYIFIAVVFDALDGFVAKKTNTITKFGGELDSLCDAVSFGVAPGYLIYHYFSGLDILLGSIFFTVCGILRLARFGVLNYKDFVGLPIPAGALILSSVGYTFIKYGLNNDDVININNIGIFNISIFNIFNNIFINNFNFNFSIILSTVAIITGLLMISDIKYVKYPKKIKLLLFGISLVLAIFGIPEILLITMVLYVIGEIKND